MRRVRTAVPEFKPCWVPSSLALQSIRMEFSDVSFKVRSPLAPPAPVHGQLICGPFGVPVNVKFTSGEMARSTIWKRERNLPRMTPASSVMVASIYSGG